MKAFVYDTFGTVDVLKETNIDYPKKEKNRIIVKIVATTVELEDPLMRRTRGINGIFKPKRNILGMEFAGTIEYCDESCGFKIGDRVFGNTGLDMGTTAEYISIDSDSAVVKIPDSISFNEAASLTNGFLTAIPFLREKGNIQKGQSILINGASGTVGAAAVQYAVYMGLKVHAICSSKNKEKVQNWGVDSIYFYDKHNIEKEIEKNRYDIIFDVAGTLKKNRCNKILKVHGVYLSTVPKVSVLFSMLLGNQFFSKKSYMIPTGLRTPLQKRSDLQLLLEMINKGAVYSNIDRIFKFHEIPAAHMHIENKKKNGTLVISLEQ